MCTGELLPHFLPRFVLTASRLSMLRLSLLRLFSFEQTKSGAAITSFRLSGLCLLTTSLFDESVLMTRFLKPLSTGRPPRADQTKKTPRRSCSCRCRRVTDGSASLL